MGSGGECDKEELVLSRSRSRGFLKDGEKGSSSELSDLMSSDSIRPNSGVHPVKQSEKERQGERGTECWLVSHSSKLAKD